MQNVKYEEKRMSILTKKTLSNRMLKSALSSILAMVLIIVMLSACKNGTGEMPTTSTTTTEKPSDIQTTASSVVQTTAPKEAFVIPTDSGPAPTGEIPGKNQNPGELKKQDVFKLNKEDYVYMFWPVGWEPGMQLIWERGIAPQLMIQAGNYGLAFESGTGHIKKIGAIEGKTQAEAATDAPDVIEVLADASSQYVLQVGDKVHESNRTFAFREARRGGKNYENTIRMINYGNTMQRFDTFVEFNEINHIAGHMEIAATPNYFTFTFEAAASEDVSDITLYYALQLSEEYSNVEWNGNHSALTIRKSNGEGLTFVSFDGVKMYVEGSKVIFASTAIDLKKSDQSKVEDYKGFSVTVIPGNKASIKDGDDLIDTVVNIEIDYQNVNYENNSIDNVSKKAEFNPRLCVFEMSPSAMSLNLDEEEQQSYLNRLKFNVKNTSTTAGSILILFSDSGRSAHYIVGGAPMLRNGDTWEPIGISVQNCKNWHANETPVLYEGSWCSMYAMLNLEPLSSSNLEYAIAAAKFGTGAFAAMHSQLSIIGWAHNQQWEESAMGCFGESITYNPDISAGRSWVDDARCLAIDNGQKWSWTGNVGGLDFLNYYNTRSKQQMLVNVKSQYISSAPCLTDIVYTGITADGSIRANMRVNMGRTDDIVRTWYTLEYEFLEDTKWTKLGFLQMCADNYDDNQYTKGAYGNSSGMIGEFDSGSFETINGKTVEGKNAWFTLYNSSQVGVGDDESANISIIVREYRANINGTEYNSPSFSTVKTAALKKDGFMLTLPGDITEVKAGSKVKIIVEYSIVPGMDSIYYGDSDWILAYDKADLGTYEPALKLATDGDTEITASVGTVTSNYPAKIEVDGDSGVVAQFYLKGGLGYTPLVFTGLDSYAGWKLEKQVGDLWTRIDQSTFAVNDYWQARYFPETDTYELVFNVPNAVENNEYRLRK